MGKFKTPLSFTFDVKTKDAMLTQFIEQIAKNKEIKSYVKFVLIRAYQLELDGRNRMTYAEFASECGEHHFNMRTKEALLLDAGLNVRKVAGTRYEFTIDMDKIINGTV